MDTVIFDGHLSGEEMHEERADQLARYKAEGRLEELAVVGSSTRCSPAAWAEGQAAERLARRSRYSPNVLRRRNWPRPCFCLPTH